MLRKILPDRSSYSKDELCSFFPDDIESSQLLAILDDMDLVHRTGDDRYLLPGKLPETSPEVDWSPRHGFEMRGRTIACMDVIDVYNPSVFPSIQKQILDSHPSSSKVWRGGFSIVFEKVQVRIIGKLTKHKRDIHMVAMYSCDSAQEAHNHLREVVDLVEAELYRKSKGTSLVHRFASRAALRKDKGDLENVWGFTTDEILASEKEFPCGMIRSQHSVDEEDTTELLFKGYDLMPLQELGSSCRYQWLPVEAAAKCFDRLDAIDDKWGENYRALGSALGLQRHEIEKLGKRQDESPTRNIIEAWCKRNQEKMTIGTLQQLLSRLSLVENEDAMHAIDGVVEKHASHFQVRLLSFLSAQCRVSV